MAIKYVVAGTSPLAWWSDSVHILLMNAIAAKWATDVTDPPVAYVLFNDTWFDDHSDLTFSFKFLRDDFNLNRRSVGWNRRNTATYIDVHMWVKTKTLATDANYVYKCKKAFEDIIELNNNTLLAPAIVTIDDVTEIPEQDHKQDVVHYVFSVTVWYDKVKVDIP
jgi:hypothetical protein